MPKRFDCVVAGSCVADVICRPVDLRQAPGAETLHPTEPIELIPGGITSNAGITLARLGQRAAVFSAVGGDAWGGLLRGSFEAAGVDTQHLMTFDDKPTSATVVLVDQDGQRSFLHHGGAHKYITASDWLDRRSLWEGARWVLLGYYPLMPRLQDDLPEVFAELRRLGCKTALDTSADGGTMHPLEAILPHTDLYVPSLVEARGQTGLEDPVAMIGRYRQAGAAGIVGIKLGGGEGVLLEPADGPMLTVPSFQPPGDVLDTTGAGDCFLAGLICGLNRGLALEAAGRLGTAAAAVSVTALGGSTAIRDLAQLEKLAR